MTHTIYPARKIAGYREAEIVDERFTSAAALKQRLDREIAERTGPRISIEIDGADIGAVQQAEGERLSLGQKVRLVDDTLGVAELAVFKELKRDLANPANIELKFETRSPNAADYLARVVRDAETPEPPVSVPASRAIFGDESDWPDANKPPSLNDWLYSGSASDSDGPKFDGDTHKSGSLQHVWPARITADQSGETQAYQVELLSPIDKSPSGVTKDNCIVADESADALSVGDYVTVAVQSYGQYALSHKTIIIGGAGATAAQWQFVWNEGE